MPEVTSLKWSKSVCGAIAFACFVSGVCSAQGMAPLAALKPAVEELKQELQLTDEQVARVQEFVIGQIGRVSAAVENFGGISFDSILDLMVEARATRDEFIPAMSSVLTEEQEAKLAKLPKAHEIYVAAVAGWLTEAQLEKLRDRLALEDNQLPPGPGGASRRLPGRGDDRGRPHPGSGRPLDARNRARRRPRPQDRAADGGAGDPAAVVGRAEGAARELSRGVGEKVASERRRVMPA
jgi:hypothetical protein